MRASRVAELATSFMILASALIVYLEIWALLSRGYTLGLLLTLFRGEHPMSDAQLAASYRQGEGVGWIMRHRLGGPPPRGPLPPAGPGTPPPRTPPPTPPPYP